MYSEWDLYDLTTAACFSAIVGHRSDFEHARSVQISESSSGVYCGEQEGILKQDYFGMKV